MAPTVLARCNLTSGYVLEDGICQKTWSFYVQVVFIVLVAVFAACVCCFLLKFAVTEVFHERSLLAYRVKHRDKILHANAEAEFPPPSVVSQPSQSGRLTPPLTQLPLTDSATIEMTRTEGRARPPLPMMMTDTTMQNDFLAMPTPHPTNTTNQSATVVERYNSLLCLRPSNLSANVPKQRRVRIR